MNTLRTTLSLAAVCLLVACGESVEPNAATAQEAPGQAPATKSDSPLSPADVVGTSDLDVSTYDAFVASLAPSFIEGDDVGMAAVAFPNPEMMQDFILRHNGPANAKAAIDMLDVTLPRDLSMVIDSLLAAREEAIAAGMSVSDARFAAAKMVSGMSIGGMKVNRLGMDISSGGRTYAFELWECRDILNRWVVMGKTTFEGVTGGRPVEQSDGSLDLDL